ncbi:STYKc [Musa troglodytarum]|uniref:STYKc n=1 Tax=Musa troglodytarum TaxID=320322 RepID=A0A9E7FN46_9LILI|nr:STYKc [Musa troglodytarum]
MQRYSTVTSGMELCFFVAFSSLVLSLLHLPAAACSCGQSDCELIALAFRHVSGFQLPPPTDDCSLRLPSRNLSGAVSWMHLRSVSALRVLDLSGNALGGSIPGGFWSAPALLHVNLASNRLGGALRVAGLAAMPRLEEVDLSRNSLDSFPLGLEKHGRLRHLDLSHNSMTGVLPEGFPPIAGGLGYLDVSYNNFTGVVQPEAVKKFGEPAFVEAGSVQFVSAARIVAHSSSRTPSRRRTRHRRSRRRKITLLSAILSVAAVAIILVTLWYCLYRVDKEEQRTRGDNEGGAATVGDEAGGAVQKADVEVSEGVSAGKGKAEEPHA